MPPERYSDAPSRKQTSTSVYDEYTTRGSGSRGSNRPIGSQRSSHSQGRQQGSRYADPVADRERYTGGYDDEFGELED